MLSDIMARMALDQPDYAQSFRPEDYSILCRQAQLRFNNNWFEWFAWMFPWLGEHFIRPLFLHTALWRKEALIILYAKMAQLVRQKREERKSKGVDFWTYMVFI